MQDTTDISQTGRSKAQIDMARQNAEQMAQYLKENYAGYWMSKGALRVAFELPSTRATVVFNMLRMYHGCELRRESVRYPKPKPQEQPKKQEEKTYVRKQIPRV